MRYIQHIFENLHKIVYEIKTVGLLNWFWFVFLIKRDTHHPSLDGVITLRRNTYKLDPISTYYKRALACNIARALNGVQYPDGFFKKDKNKAFYWNKLRK